MNQQADDWHEVMTVRDVFIMLRRLDLIDRATSFNEFIEWMGELRWYAKLYRAK
jgi:hypothetical protein